MPAVRKAGVLSLRADKHAEAVCHLAKVRGKSIHHFASDHFHECPSSVSFKRGNLCLGEITDTTGVTHDLAEFATIWWRRPYGSQVRADTRGDTAVDAIVRNSTRSHIEGVFLTAFQGRLINRPSSAQKAENKLAQLSVANAVGFLTPKTLFSNDYKRILEFYEALGGRVVVKSHYNSPELQLKTIMIAKEMLDDQASFRIAPSIYQEFIDGDEHFRVFAIDDKYQAVRFINPSVDSRYDLSGPAEEYRFGEDIESKIRKYLLLLELEVGIFDFKMNQHGELYFLEVNQQGQFAYLDVIANTKCLEMMVSRLLEQD